MLLRLVLALVLVVGGATALVVVGFVALDGRSGGAAFAVATTSQPTSTLQPTRTEADHDHPEEAPTLTSTAPRVEPTTTTAPSIVQPPGPPTSPTSVEAAPGLHDLPPFNQPAGYEIKDRWSDGPSRLTLWQGVEGIRPIPDIFDLIDSGMGRWRTTRTGTSDGLTWATMRAVGHPWCIWLEIYGEQPDADDGGAAAAATLFLVVEGPFCDPEPGSFA